MRSFSVIIRCLNEERHLPVLLDAIQRQSIRPEEVVLVDSGSTDNTVQIALRKGTRVVHIDQREFSFGRALNVGASAATGTYLVIASAHTYPVSERWFELLLKPFEDSKVALVYGGQRGNHLTKFSEHRIFQQWFPDDSCDDQRHPFCNNANSAVRRDIWETMPYDEDVPGLEDIHWTKRALERGYKIVYRADAAVVHVHEESYAQVYRRYHREAMALRMVSPWERMGIWHTFLLLAGAIKLDLSHAYQEGVLARVFWSVLCFRTAQYFGAYRGLRWHGKVSEELRARLYYPRGYQPAGRLARTLSKPKVQKAAAVLVKRNDE